MSRDESTRNQEGEKRSAHARWLRLLFLPVFLAGALFFGFDTGRPLLQMLKARGWKETPCVVLSSRVHTYQGDEGASYGVDIAYRYAWTDRHYTSLRYSFAAGAWGGQGSRQEIVDKHHEGTETVCFVNPASPAEAVLNRGWQPEMGLGVFGFVIALAAALGFAFAGQIVGKREQSAGATTGPTGSARSPMLNPISTLIGALFWNGCVGGMAYLLFFVEDRKDVATGPKIIISLLLLAGLGLLWSAFSRLTSGRKAN